jgi:hypothetical protein
MSIFDSFKKSHTANTLIYNNLLRESSSKEFDLNIEKILENWEVYHAVREIIANALDEQILTNTKDISICKTNDGCWHILDYGRGLNYHHLTQNENEEKLNSSNLIGRFGVGLKDALATLYRHGIKIKIISKYGCITLKKASKNGFDDITTLHAEIIPSQNPNMIGTDFCLFGCNAEDIDKAKSLFLKFSGKQILEKTLYGEVIENTTDIANIYINGVKVAEEPNFLFSYNITSLTTQLKKTLNRERTNVGRSAYTGRIKDILKACLSEKVINTLVDDLQQFGSGNKHDELSWNEISMHASVKMSHLHKDTTFVTTADLQDTPSLIDDMRRSGYNPVVVPDNIIPKMEDYNSGAKNGETLTTVRQYLKQEQERFIPIPVDINTLTMQEKEVYNKTDAILKLIGGIPKNVRNIIIVEKIYESEAFNETLGLWVPIDNSIIIKRNQLKSIKQYSGTLLHECAHAISGKDDLSRGFELELTEMLGIISSKFV